MKKITTLLLLLLMIIGLSGCINNDQDPIDQPDEPTTYEIIQEAIDNTTISDTIEDVLLPTNYGNVTITWTSNIGGTITSTGRLIQGTENQLVTLTGLFSYQDKQLTKLYTTTILKNMDVNYDLIDVTAAANELSFEDLTVTEDITLVSVYNGVTVTWQSSNPTCVSNTGEVSRPSEDSEDCTSVLTATFSKGTETTTETYNFIVLSLTTSVIYTGYYEGIDGLTGVALLNELNEILNDGFSGVTYGDARYILDETDADPSDPSKVILVYLQTSVSGTWDSGITWNREHVWPQSLLGESADNGTVNMASDLQNLKPANPSENSSRGNKYFDNSTTSTTYEPPSEVKGDVARILFYMCVMYDELDLVESNPSTYQMARLSVLLLWNVEDPVDDFERNRNEIIYSYQGNRNPFIDHPELADLIWNN